MTKSIIPKLKIGFVLDDGLDKPDGVQQYILTLGEWFKNQGHEVRYLVGETTRKDIADAIELSRNIKVSFNGNKLSIPFWPKLSKIKKTLRQEKFDILHIQVPFSPIMGGRVIAAAPKGTGLVGTFHILPLHTSLLYVTGNKLTALSIRSGLKKIEKHFSVSKPAREFAKDFYGIDSEILGNPIKLDDFKPVKKDFQTIKRLKIIFLGRLVSRKGCRTLLQAINALPLRYRKNIRVNIGGDGTERKALEEYVESHGLRDIVTFNGFIEEKNKIKFLKDSDLAIFPSKGGESFGIVLLEAMAASGPVVLAGDNPGYRSVLKDSKEALFKPDDYKNLAQKITHYLDNTKLLTSVYNQQQRLVKTYDIEKIGKSLLVNFQSIVQNKNK